MERDGTPRARQGSGYHSEAAFYGAGSVYVVISYGLGVPNGKQRDPSML
jgi:hypothetical protein